MVYGFYMFFRVQYILRVRNTTACRCRPAVQGDTLIFNVQHNRSMQRTTACSRWTARSGRQWGWPHLSVAFGFFYHSSRVILYCSRRTLVFFVSFYLNNVQNLFKTLKYIQYYSISVQNHTKNSKHKSKFIKPALLIKLQ